MLGSRSAYTRAQILVAAGRLFAQKGYANTSLREITTAARVNLSSVNYHFGSKEGLAKAVYQQQLDTLNRERLSFLDCLEAQAAGQPIPPILIVDAFFQPLIHLALDHARRAQEYASPADIGPPDTGFLQTLVMHNNPTTLSRFRAALLQALPALPEQELLWRFQFMLGATSCALASLDGLLLAAEPQNIKVIDADALTNRLMAFLNGGLQAPLPQFGVAG